MLILRPQVNTRDEDNRAPLRMQGRSIAAVVCLLVCARGLPLVPGSRRPSGMFPESLAVAFLTG